MFAEFERRGIDYCLVGGLAVVAQCLAHGGDGLRATVDADAMVPQDYSNAEFARDYLRVYAADPKYADAIYEAVLGKGGFEQLNEAENAFANISFVGADEDLEALADPGCGWFYRRDAETYESIPGSPIVYWASKGVVDAFESGTPIRDIGEPRVGLQTGENARFVRQWWEVSLGRELFDCSSVGESVGSGRRWFPYNKGGDYRKWYGNNDCVVNWENDGFEIRKLKDANGRLLSRPQNTQWYFKPSITWSKISSGSIAFRYKPAGHVFDVAGTSIFAEEEVLKYMHGACNSSVILQIAGMLSPTLNFEVGQIATYPIVFEDERRDEIIAIVEELRALSRQDWDTAETSWDHHRHALV